MCAELVEARAFETATFDKLRSHSEVRGDIKT